MLSDLFLECGGVAISFKKQVLLSTNKKKSIKTDTKEKEITNDAVVHKKKLSK